MSLGPPPAYSRDARSAEVDTALGAAPSIAATGGRGPTLMLDFPGAYDDFNSTGGFSVKSTEGAREGLGDRDSGGLTGFMTTASFLITST